MAKSFYVTLQSNASMDLLPDNKISDFRNRLGTLISLPPGKWEVALTDISYTAGLSYIRQGDVLFTLEAHANALHEQVITSKGDATTWSEFADILNNSIPNLTFKLDQNISTYSIVLINANQVVYTTDKLRDLLGLKANILTSCPKEKCIPQARHAELKDIFIQVSKHQPKKRVIRIVKDKDSTSNQLVPCTLGSESIRSSFSGNFRRCPLESPSLAPRTKVPALGGTSASALLTNQSKVIYDSTSRLGWITIRLRVPVLLHH
jgi:hypothetical protein